jgi:hypothetical protein
MNARKIREIPGSSSPNVSPLTSFLTSLILPRNVNWDEKYFVAGHKPENGSRFGPSPVNPKMKRVCPQDANEMAGKQVVLFDGHHKQHCSG